MSESDFNAITYHEADVRSKERIANEWGELPARHMHLEDGFSIVAVHEESIVGLISVFWQLLPPPLPKTYEGYINIIEVAEAFRRQGIATKLVAIAAQRSQTQGVYQLRAWSSADKTQAIPMWKKLGFGLCPASTYPQGKEVRGYFAIKLL